MYYFNQYEKNKNRYTFFTGQILVWDMEWTKENIKTTGELELNQSRVHGLESLPNSMQVIPRDQMSIFPSYWPSSIARITSGAILRKHSHVNDRYIAFDLMENIEWDYRGWTISKFFPIFQTPSIFLVHWNSATHQYGVPTKELAGETMEAEPKSASFTWPGSVSKTFPALISLSARQRREMMSLHLCSTGTGTLPPLGHKEVSLARPHIHVRGGLTGESSCGNEGKLAPVEHRG